MESYTCKKRTSSCNIPFGSNNWKHNEHKSSYQLKETSVTDASATPPIIGIRDPTTQRVGNCFSKIITRINNKHPIT